MPGSLHLVSISRWLQKIWGQLYHEENLSSSKPIHSSVSLWIFLIQMVFCSEVPLPNGHHPQNSSVTQPFIIIRWPYTTADLALLAIRFSPLPLAPSLFLPFFIWFVPSPPPMFHIALYNICEYFSNLLLQYSRDSVLTVILTWLGLSERPSSHLIMVFKMILFMDNLVHVSFMYIVH